MSQTLQNRPLPMPENYSEYSFNPEITVEGVASPEQLAQSADFRPEYLKHLRGLVQDATSEVELSVQGRSEDFTGVLQETEDIITPKIVATRASHIASETVNLRHHEINAEMRSQN